MKPITNQVSRIRTNNKDGLGSYYIRQDRTKQVKPYNLPAAYLSHHIVVYQAKLFGTSTTYSGLANAGAVKGFGVPGPDVPTRWDGNRQRAVNEAFSKFRSSIHEEAMLAVNYQERQRSATMMRNRLMQILEFTRALARRDLKGVCESLRIRPEQVPASQRREVFRIGSVRRGTRAIVLKKEKKQKYQGSKGYANAWLEYHFGWDPLVKDIHACVEILQKPLPDHMVTVSGPKVRNEYSDRRLQNPLSAYASYQVREENVWVRGKIGSQFVITNSDIYLANRLGLVNPASIAWELVPFSFVIDWFFTLNDFLAQWTDFAGLSLNNSWWSWTMVVEAGRYEEHYVRLPKETFGMEIAGSSVHSQRIMGLPTVTLALRPPKRVSVVRAATAIALLVQQLPRGWADNGQKQMPKIRKRLVF